MNKPTKLPTNTTSVLTKESLPEVRILQSIRRIIRAIDIHSKELVSQYNITAPQLLALEDIAEHDRTTITELTKRIYLDASTLVGIIDRLEGKGLVRRERDKNDRRQIHIYISDKGKDFIENSPIISKSSVTKAIQAMSESDQQQFSRLLDKMLTHMEK